jgi:hypothetical protein
MILLRALRTSRAARWLAILSIIVLIQNLLAQLIINESTFRRVFSNILFRASIHSKPCGVREAFSVTTSETGVRQSRSTRHVQTNERNVQQQSNNQKTEWRIEPHTHLIKENMVWFDREQTPRINK